MGAMLGRCFQRQACLPGFVPANVAMSGEKRSDSSSKQKSPDQNSPSDPEPLRNVEFMGKFYSLGEYQMICSNLRDFIATLKRWAAKEDQDVEANTSQNSAD